MTDDLGKRLAAPFGETHRDTRGGVTFDYLTGEQVIRRLNETLGVGGWTFMLREHGIHAEADEVWVLGEVSVHVDGWASTRQQFGSQKIRRAKNTAVPVDIGFDLKGAATDALKKCASLLGVGLYLSERPGVLRSAQGQAATRPAAPVRAVPAPTGPTCQDCNQQLRAWRTSDGRWLQPVQLAKETMDRFGRVLCGRDARRAAS